MQADALPFQAAPCHKTEVSKKPLQVYAAGYTADADTSTVIPMPCFPKVTGKTAKKVLLQSQSLIIQISLLSLKTME